MARTVSLYGLSAAARASVEAAGLQISEDSYPPLRCNTMVLSASLPLAPESALTILVADCNPQEPIKISDVLAKPYYYLKADVRAEIQLPLIPINDKLDAFLQYFSPVVSFDCDCEVIPLLTDQSGRLVAFCYRTDEGKVIVIPPLSAAEQYGPLLQLLVKSADKLTAIPVPYTSDKEKWKKLNEKLSQNREKFQKSISDTELEIEKSFPESIFLTGLLSADEKAFDKAVKAFISYLGLEAEGEYVLDAERRLLLSASVATGQVSSLSQLSKQVAKERKAGSEVHGLAIVNSYRYLPLKQKPEAFTHLLIGQAQQSELTLVSSSDLLRLYENIESGIISRSWAISQLFVSGLTTFHVPDENYISTVAKIATNDPSLCRFILDGTPIRKGMKVIIEAVDGHLRRDVITSLTAGKVAMAEASDGEVTVRFSNPVFRGEKLFFGL